MELPKYVQIEPVGQCNLRCQMCPIQFRRDGPPYGPPAFMDFENFKQLIKEFSNLEELHLQGIGEPLMHPRFFDMVRYAKSRGIRVTTNTNLTLLTRKRAEQLVTSGLDCLHISIDGSTAKTFERIRVRARFEDIIRNLEQILQARRHFQSEFPHLHMVVVIMKQNLHELPELVQLAHRWSIDEVFVQHLCHDFQESSLPQEYRPMRDFVEEETLLSEDTYRIESYFQEARNIAQEHDVVLRLPHTRPKLYPPHIAGRERCDWPWTGAYISYQGDAMPCCMVATPDRINFGNMIESGVQSVWNSRRYQKFRDRLDSQHPPEICQSCSLYHGTF